MLFRSRASALGEFFERLNTHYFWTHFYLGATRANRPFVHYPQEPWSFGCSSVTFITG